MRTNGKILAALLCLIVFAGCLSACGGGAGQGGYAKVNDDGTITYYTDDSVDPLNYTLYVNKEITLITNILSTHMANGDSVARGNYSAESELVSVESDLDMVAEAIQSVEYLNPPNEYTDDRTAILTAMLNAQDSLTKYKAALEGGGELNISDCVDLMEGDFINLTGKMHGSYWE